MGVGENFLFFLVPPKFFPNSHKSVLQDDECFRDLDARRINTIVLLSIVPKKSFGCSDFHFDNLFMAF